MRLTAPHRSRPSRAHHAYPMALTTPKPAALPHRHHPPDFPARRTARSRRPPLTRCHRVPAALLGRLARSLSFDREKPQHADALPTPRSARTIDTSFLKCSEELTDDIVRNSGTPFQQTPPARPSPAASPLAPSIRHRTHRPVRTPPRTARRTPPAAPYPTPTSTPHSP